ncbi:MAG TPA: TonB-dependent receptor [Gemmatimonadales bacterium]|jgi:outer membrane receptor for ferrienterochelin and colicins
MSASQAPRGHAPGAHCFFFLPFCAFCLLFGPRAAAAQDSTTERDSATVTGQLVGRETHDPISGAAVTLLGTNRATNTDSTGRFALAGLAPGAVLLEIRAVGYATGDWRITLRPGKVLDQVFELELLPYDVPGVTVKAKPRQPLRRFADFERRRHSGMGYFLTKEQIERAGATHLVDILVTVRGVQQVCLSNDCIAKMVRSPAGCYPQYFLDGIASTPYFARNTPPEDVQGVEIYRGSSETPGEFIGSNSACGVIAIWTKSAP